MARVLRIIARLNMGGPARCVIRLAREMTPLGFETLVAAGVPEPSEGDMTEELLAAGGSLERIPEMGKPIRPFRDMKALFALRALVRKFKPDIIHTHTAKAGFLGRAAAFAAKPPPVRIHTFHGHVLDGYFGPLRSAFFRTIERFLARRSDALVAVSPSTKHELLRIHRVGEISQYRVIPSGYPVFSMEEAEDLRRELGLGGSPVVGMVGRLVPVKGPEVLVRALPILLERIPDIKVLFAGDGPMRPVLEAAARSPALKEALRFAGMRKDTVRIFKTLDVLALPSFKEGLPTVILEAAAAGVAVAAARIPGVLDLLEEERSALLFEPGSAEGLAGAVIRLVEDAGLRGRLADEAGRSLAAKVPDYEGVAKAHAELYNELMERRRG